MLSLLGYSTTAFQILTSCTRTLDDYWLASAQTQNGQTNTGTCFFTTVATEPGYYRICMHARSLLSKLNPQISNNPLLRFKQGGNAGDVTIQAGSTTYAGAFGDGDQRDWRSTGQCFIQVNT